MTCKIKMIYMMKNRKNILRLVMFIIKILYKMHTFFKKHIVIDLIVRDNAHFTTRIVF